MKKFMTFIIICLLSISIVFLYQAKMESIPSISFFPIAKEASFADAQTTLSITSSDSRDKYSLSWNTSSRSDKSMYLRQDVSLLYKNGKLLGALSKWNEEEDTIQLSETIETMGTSYFQTISFHHGELHYQNGSIKSIQKMTNDSLFVIQNPSGEIRSFHKPETTKDIKWEKSLTAQTSQTLLYHWNKLLQHYQISKEDYLLVPFTELYQYENKPIPSMTQEQTDQIIGQLWEGLYVNYIVPITSENKRVSSFVPIILFSKKNEHLLVLFELNGKKHRLIQQYK